MNKIKRLAIQKQRRRFRVRNKLKGSGRVRLSVFGCNKYFRVQAIDDTAGVQLLDEIKALARKHGVLLENPLIRPPEPQSDDVAVAIEVEVKSAWSPLISFLYDLQTPESFVALDSANLRVDAEDQTRLHGRFKIARWHAQPLAHSTP